MSIGFINGKFVKLNEKVIPIEERGHQFGDGVYEVVKVYNGSPLLLDEHLERLAKSASAIQVALPYSLQEIKEIILKGIVKSEVKNAEVYFQITRGIVPRNHLFPVATKSSFTMTVKPSRQVPKESYETGVDTITAADDRWANCHIKSLNLLPNILAKQTAADANKYEAILVRDGLITEGSSTNLFAIKDETLYTTPLTSNILAGITRATLIELAEKENIEVVEQDFSVDFLQTADEAFLSSTIIEVLPIRSVDDVLITDGNPGKLTKHMHELYSNLYAKKIKTT